MPYLFATANVNDMTGLNIMREFFSKLTAGIRRSSLFQTFNLKDDLGKGRFCMLSAGIVSSTVAQLSGGLFYTGYLIGHGIDIVSIAIISFVPYFTSFLGILSPIILRKFKKPRKILAFGRILYYMINILGITFLPMVISAEHPGARLWGFIGIIVLANAANAVFSPGYTAWQSNFLPDEVRANYFTSSSCINSFLVNFIALMLSIITDKLDGSPKQLEVLTLFRIIAFALAIIDVIIISLPKEFEYKSSETTKLTSVFTLPFKNKAFFCSTLIVCLYSFSQSLPNATLNTYLLETVKAGYTYQNGINASYFLFFIVFGTMWKKFIARKTWFRAFAIALSIQGFTYIAYAFVTHDNYLWLMTAVRLSQHVLGVVMNTIIASIPYINLPDDDKALYLVFHSISTSFASLGGMMAGTLVVKLMGDSVLKIFGIGIESTPLLLLCCGIFSFVITGITMSLMKIVTPKYHTPAPRIPRKLRKSMGKV